MLDRRWKRIAIALRIYAGSLLVGMIAAVAHVALPVLGWLGVDVLLITASVVVHLLDGLALLGFLVGTGAVLVFATVPGESGARLSAILAALTAVTQLGVAASSVAFVRMEQPGLVALATAVEPLLALLTLAAMSRALMHVGGFIRADEVYARANMLFVGLLLLLVGGCCLSGVVGQLARAGGSAPGAVVAVAALAGIVFAVLIAVAYLLLVFKASRAIDELLVE